MGFNSGFKGLNCFLLVNLLLDQLVKKVRKDHHRVYKSQLSESHESSLQSLISLFFLVCPNISLISASDLSGAFFLSSYQTKTLYAFFRAHLYYVANQSKPP